MEEVPCPILAPCGHHLVPSQVKVLGHAAPTTGWRRSSWRRNVRWRSIQAFCHQEIRHRLHAFILNRRRLLRRGCRLLSWRRRRWRHCSRLPSLACCLLLLFRTGLLRRIRGVISPGLVLLTCAVLRGLCSAPLLQLPILGLLSWRRCHLSCSCRNCCRGCGHHHSDHGWHCCDCGHRRCGARCGC